MDQPRILIADDDADTLYVYSRLLQSDGYVVVTAPSAAECLRAVQEERPDLILLDVQLPDLSGLDVCRQIKSDPEFAGMFVVHISGIEVSAEIQAEALETGADLYLTKPVEYRKLLAHIGALLRIKTGFTAVLVDQQKRELELLNRLSAPPPASVAAQMFGALPLRENLPDAFNSLVELYADLLDLALQQRAYRVEHNITERLHMIVDRLGALKAKPRDVVDIHRAALHRKSAESSLTKRQAYVEEGRTRLVEMMGYLVSYYRTLAMGVDLRDYNDGPARSVRQGKKTYE